MITSDYAIFMSGIVFSHTMKKRQGDADVAEAEFTLVRKISISEQRTADTPVYGPHRCPQCPQFCSNLVKNPN